MAYVAVKGGEKAIEQSLKLLEMFHRVTEKYLFQRLWKTCLCL